MTDRRHFLHLAAAGTAGSLLPSACSAPEPGSSEARRPNIVMIMSDDMGYSDLGCYGGEIATPNLDRLGYNDLRFTRYYTNNMCVPTRACLMSGVYNTRSVLKGGTISSQVVTIAEVLREAGYSTYMSGKWHLAKPEDQANWPCQRGFDEYYGHLTGAASFWAPAFLKRNNESAEADYQDEDYYYTDGISDHAVEFVEDAFQHDKPFFLYVAYTAAHWPLHAFEEDIAKYKGNYALGWDNLRQQRHARMKELGVINPDWELSPRHPNVPAWEDEPHKEWQQRRMEVYAAQVDRMDRGIGRIIAAIEKRGELDNTLIVFQIDNGGCHVEYTPDRKGSFLPEKTRDGRPMRPGNLPHIMPGPEDTYQSYGYGWANAGNTPFRLFKQHDHEGGITVPLIVHWPSVIREGGEITDQVGHVIDLMPTFLDAAGAEYPGTFKGHPIVPCDGKTLLPVFRGERREPHHYLCWQWSRGRAIRKGNWKLVGLRNQPWELYDIEADGTELHDLAGQMSEKVEELSALWEAWAG